MKLVARDVLPADAATGVLVGRVWISSPHAGPRVVAIRQGEVFDLSALAPTLADLFDLPDTAEQVRRYSGARLFSLDDALSERRLLAPCDLQAIKAAGVT